MDSRLFRLCETVLRAAGWGQHLCALRCSCVADRPGLWPVAQQSMQLRNICDVSEQVAWSADKHYELPTLYLPSKHDPA